MFISGPGPGAGSGNQQYRGGPQNYPQQGPQQGYPGQYPNQNQTSAQVMYHLPIQFLLTQAVLGF